MDPVTDIRNAAQLPDEYLRRILGILIENTGGSLHIEEQQIVGSYDQSPRVPHIVGFRSDQPGSGITLEVVNHDTT